MTALDRRAYTDRQVRENAELMAFAVGYAGAYEGDFEFLVKARQYVEREGELPVQVARGVLNCARHDLNVAGSLPEPALPVGCGEDGVVVPMRRKPRKRPEETKPERRWATRTRVRIRAPYLLPDSGYRIHLVRSSPALFAETYSQWMEWRPRRHPDDWDLYVAGWEDGYPALHATTVCSRSFDDPVLLLSRDQAPENSLCRSCERIAGEKGWELP